MQEWILNITVIAATAAIVYGCHQVYAPAAWIAGGVLTLAGALRIASRLDAPDATVPTTGPTAEHAKRNTGKPGL